MQSLQIYVFSICSVWTFACCTEVLLASKSRIKKIIPNCVRNSNCYLRETGTHSHAAHMLAMEDVMCGMMGMDSSIIIQPALTRYILQQDFLREQYGIPCKRISCIPSMYS